MSAAATQSPTFREAFPLAIDGARAVIAMADQTLEEFDARMMQEPVDTHAELTHQWGDLHLLLFAHGYPTIDRTVRARFLSQGSNAYETAVRAHPREAASEKSRVGELRELLTTLVPAEEWRRNLDALEQAANEAKDQAIEAKQHWEAEVDLVRPKFQAEYDAAVALLKEQYAQQVATVEERHGAAALTARWKKAMEKSVDTHRKKLDGILKFLRKALGAKRVAEAMAAYDREEAHRNRGQN